MCVIIAQPKEAYLARDVALAAWKHNPDGGGFSYIDEDSGKPVVFKYMTFEKFWGHFERARSDNRERDFLVHFRIATHGSVCLANVHPFQVDDDTVMAHNGIIHSMPAQDPEGKDRSDSRLFVDTVLPALGGSDWLDNPYVVEMVEDYIGWSRLAFLTTNPKLSRSLYILNEKKGEMFRGMWFSNFNGMSEFKPKPPPKTKYGKTYAAPGRYPQKQIPASHKTTADWEAEQRKKKEADLESAFADNAWDHIGDYHPKDWAEDPIATGISAEECQRRWEVIFDEIEDMMDARKTVWKIPHKLGFQPSSMTIYCDKCLKQADMSGMCACFDLGCWVCQEELANCHCVRPSRIDGELLGKEVVPSLTT